jgi:zinc protease
VLVVAGDVDPDELRARVQELFGGWRRAAEAPPIRTPIPAPRPTAARLTIVDRPGSPRSPPGWCCAVASIDSPQRPAVLVVHDLLGGMRSSAVKEGLREELRATWSMSDELAERRGTGLSWWEWSVSPEDAPRTLAEFDRRVRELRERGPSPDDLAVAKSLKVRSLPRQLESVDGLASAFATIVAYGLPLDDLATLGRRIEALSAADVRAAVPPAGAMKVVIVGDLAALRVPLLALGWGPIEVRNEQGDIVRTIAH